MPKGTRHTTESFIAAAKAKWGDVFGYDKVSYVDLVTDVTITCPVHGDVPMQPKFHILSSTKHGCPMCGKDESGRKRSEAKIKKFSKLFEQKSRKVHGDLYDYSLVNYIGQDYDVDIICPIHGVFQQKPIEHWGGCGCQKCGRDRTRAAHSKPFIEFVQESNKLHGGKYTYDEPTYIGANKPTRIICKTHGEFWCSPSNHTDKLSGCPSCSSPVSRIELEVASWFDWDKLNDRKILSGKELDMVSEKHKLAVEINGTYWHSETCGKDAKYHLDKMSKCFDAGYTLMQFYDSEAKNKPDVVRSMITNKMGESGKIHARKCNLIELDYKTASEFLELNHINGSSVASKCYGLVHNEEIVSVMTLAKPRFSKHEWEMIRFANKCGLSVVGGASKLFAGFVRSVNPTSVVTYANLRYSNGGVYNSLGFVETHQTKPNYEYHKGKSKVSRYAAQKHKLQAILGDKFDSNKSETQNMLDNGFHKVYDCGNKVFEWTNKEQK